MSETVQNDPGVNAVSKRALTIKVFGIGSAGVNILEQLARDGVTALSLIAVHSDGCALAACLAGEKVLIKNKTAGGLSTANKPGRRAATVAEDQLARLKSLCAGADVIFLVAGP